jgi:hypothetical protein
MSRLADALAQIEFARKYSTRLIDTIDPADWFRMPAEGVTHVAWQVGHLAMAEYRLCLERLRGTRPEDEAFIPKAFIATHVRDSTPTPDPSKYLPPADIRRVFDEVHARVQKELPSFPDADLDSPLLTPHVMFKTKIETLRWCSQHEMSHAGQIGLLRRLFGQKPLW